MVNTGDSLSIVIPVYNSNTILRELYTRLIKEIEPLTVEYEIIFVNDCSPDDSWQILREIASEDPHVKAILLRKNVGYDNALMAGLKSAKMSYVVTMDDDLQHAPEDIPKLLEGIKEGGDVVYANFKKKKQSFIKNLGSWINGKLAQLIIKKPPGIYLSPFKILRNEIVSEIVKYNGPFPYIDGLIFQVTSSIHQVTVTHHKRAKGKGGHGIYRSLRIVFNFCTTFSILPLRIVTITGFSISMLAIIFSAVLVIGRIMYSLDVRGWTYYLLGINVDGWTSIMLGVVIMGGIQLMCIGIIGEYIGRSYMNINRQPQYVVKEFIKNRGREE